MERGKEKQSKEAAESMNNLPTERAHTKTSISKLTAEQKAKNLPRKMDTPSMTVEEIRNVRITGAILDARKRHAKPSPTKPGFKPRTLEPAKKKAQSTVGIQRISFWMGRIETQGLHYNLSSLIQTKGQTLTCIGPLSWLVAAGRDINRYACTIKSIIDDRGIDWDSLINLPDELKGETANCRNNPTPPDHRFAESFALPKKI